MLKKSASGVLASLRGSMYGTRYETSCLFTRCGLAGGLFEHPAGVSALVRDVQAAEALLCRNGFSVAC